MIIAVTEKGARVQTETSRQRFRVRIFTERLCGSRQHVRFDEIGAVSAGKFTPLVNHVNIVIFLQEPDDLDRRCLALSAK